MISDKTGSVNNSERYPKSAGKGTQTFENGRKTFLGSDKQGCSQGINLVRNYWEVDAETKCTEKNVERMIEYWNN